MARRRCRSTLRPSPRPLCRTSKLSLLLRRRDGALNDGTRSSPTDAGSSSYYCGPLYDYVSGLAYQFCDVVHVVEQPWLNGCTLSQLGIVAELKDDIDLDYSKSCGEARYKPTRERNPNCKKTPYAILRYLLLTPFLQRLYASEATAERMTWQANHQMEEGSMYHPFEVETWRHFDRTYPNFATEPRNVRLNLCADSMVIHILVGPLYLHRTISHRECA
ncbi:UNVERIFIED_CONTAM: hypothetical protein Slati_3515400 [Sesamum latifolium]|uniref:Uncharacterized protein n=1 Tax=Sesamum latifolium TaxID=2727402 RepID=A0AAW2UKV2_9LAMI